MRPMMENFWSHVDKNGSCWLWTGRIDDKGYGRLSYKGQPSVGAHRVAYALTYTNGQLPDEWVLHDATIHHA